jgi:hypothetical protein
MISSLVGITQARSFQPRRRDLDGANATVAEATSSAIVLNLRNEIAEGDASHHLKRSSKQD